MSTKFYEYVESYRVVRPFMEHEVSADVFYEATIDMHLRRKDAAAVAHMHWEKGWRASRRPYYRIYPKAVKMFLGLNIENVQCSSIRKPAGLSALIVDMPAGNALMDDGRDVHHFMIDFDAENNTHGEMVTFGVNYGEGGISEKLKVAIPVWDTWYFTIQKNGDLANCLQNICSFSESAKAENDKFGLHTLSINEMYRFSSLMAMLCLLDDQPDLLRSEVLAADRIRVTPENRDRLADKARRRGKIGWVIGEDLESREVSPHFRNAHPCLFWVDKGRSRQVIKMRSHSFPNLNAVKTIPTGFKDDEGSTTQSEQISD